VSTSTPPELEDFGQYKFGWHDPATSVFTPKRGLSADVVREISAIKDEPEWMTRFRLRALDWLLVTPRFHHWHHAAHPEAVDRNFAVHLPWIDRLFGTAHLPVEWPQAYGIAGDPVPEGYWRQLKWPFRPSAPGS